MITSENVATWSYIAALIDCRGTLSMTRAGVPYVSVTMVRQAMLRVFAAAGNETIHQYKPQRRGLKPLSVVRYNGLRAEAILQGARPYLRDKGTQADLLLEFFRNEERRRPYQRRTQAEIDYANEVYWRLRSLNGTNTPDDSEDEPTPNAIEQLIDDIKKGGE